MTWRMRLPVGEGPVSAIVPQALAAPTNVRRFHGMVPPSSIIRASLDDSAGAIFGRDQEQFRYLLWRQAIGGVEKQVTFVMLNPSTADENVLDPTLRRCWSFTSQWGFNRMEIVNLFAYRATNPKDMIAQGLDAAVGFYNDWFIRDSAIRAELVVCAWGANAKCVGRARKVLQMLAPLVPLHCAHLTKAGSPGHPLYLPDGIRPVPFLGVAA